MIETDRQTRQLAPKATDRAVPAAPESLDAEYS